MTLNEFKAVRTPLEIANVFFNYQGIFTIAFSIELVFCLVFFVVNV